MSTINWKPGLILKIDGNSVRDYTIDWTAWLSGQTITSLTIAPVNCSAVQTLLTSTHLTFRASAVLADARVTFRVTTNLGQVEDFSIIFLLEVR
jgi:hypothetical protein